MTNVIHIERAVPGDTGLISDLSSITFIETYRGSCTDEDLVQFIDKSFSELTIGEELREPGDFYYIAFKDNIPAGYMRLKEDYTDYPAMKRYRAIELKRIYVLKEYQSAKVGAALMSTALELAAKNNYEAIWLGVWEHNERAKLFYKRFAFNDTGFTHKFFIGGTGQTDHWLIKFIGEEHKEDIYP